MEAHLIQGSESWKELRKTKITSTDASIIMGCNNFKTPYKLWRQKMDLDPPEEETEIMRRGTMMEPYARDWFIKETGIHCEPKVVFKDFMMASLDGISKNEQFILEIKCGEKSFSSACIGEIPNYYVCQILHQMYVSNVEVAYYLAFNGKEGIIIEVKRDQEFINQMIEKEMEFYKCLITFTPPPLTNRDYNMRSDYDFNFLSMQYQNAYKKLKEAEIQEKKCKEKLIELCGSQSTMGNNIKISKIPRKGSVDYSLIPELKGLDLDKYRKETIEYWKISISD